MSMYVLFIMLTRLIFVSFAGAKVRRFFNSPNFFKTFFEVFLSLFVKRLIFSDVRSEVFLRKKG